LPRALQIGKVNPTLGDVQRFSGIEVIICATSLTRRAPLYIKSSSHPAMSVLEVLRMSCAIPLYFTPVLLGGEVLVDGCLTDCTPVRGLGPVDLADVLVLDVNDDLQPGDDLQVGGCVCVGGEHVLGHA
jgi:predicted acylesterase/phospholipase RssA